MNGVDIGPAESGTRRTAQVLAILGIVLIGIIIGNWTNVPVDGGTQTVETSGQAQRRAGATVLLTGVAASLIAAALLLMRRDRARPVDELLRDPATGFYRRAYVDAMLANLMARDDRNGRSQLALVSIHVDYLDDIDRRYGKAASERLLQFCARQLRGQCRECDLPQRNDNGFEVFLQCEDVVQAEAFCRRLTLLLAREQFEVEGDVLKVETRMGAAVRDAGESVDSLRERSVARLIDHRPGAAPAV